MVWHGPYWKSSWRGRSDVLHSFVPEVPRRRANIPQVHYKRPPCWRGLALISLVPVGAGNDRNWCLSPPPAPDSCPPGPPPPHYRGLGLETLVEQVAGIAQTCAPTPLPVVHTGSDTPRPKTTGGGAPWSTQASLVQVGRSPARGPHSSKWGPAAQTCSGRLSAGRSGHQTCGAPVFLREP